MAASMQLTKAASPSAHTEFVLRTVAAPGFLAPEETSVQGPMLAVCKTKKTEPLLQAQAFTGPNLFIWLQRERLQLVSADKVQAGRLCQEALGHQHDTGFRSELPDMQPGEQAAVLAVTTAVKRHLGTSLRLQQRVNSLICHLESRLGCW